MKVICLLFILVKLSLANGLYAQFEGDTTYRNLKLEQITQVKFDQSAASYFKAIKRDSILKKLNLTVVQDCRDICETYLEDRSNGNKKYLPSNFDGGILGLLFSKRGKKMAVYSSYDGPDYTNYYAYRAEIIIYDVTKKKGLSAIQFSFNYTTEEWSIDRLVWVNRHTLALKVYTCAKNKAETEDEYQYFKTDLRKTVKANE